MCKIIFDFTIENVKNLSIITTEIKTKEARMPDERRDEHREEKNNEEKNNKVSGNAVLWPWVLAGGMVVSSVIMCLCGRGCTKRSGCHDCNKPKQDTVWVVKEKPSIDVDGDAIIINGDNNDAILIKGNGNNAANRSSGNQNRGGVKPKPKKLNVIPAVNPAPVVEPNPEPKPQENNCSITISYREVEVINGRCR